jgi:uncharacterized protein with HEPN domain
MKDDRLYLTNIKDCIERIESYTSAGKDTFLETPMIQDAVIRNFEVIGEATKRLSENLKAEHPDIAWRQIAGFRDVLIHDYLKININRIWGVIEKDLPPLKRIVEQLLSSD